MSVNLAETALATNAALSGLIALVGCLQESNHLSDDHVINILETMLNSIDKITASELDKSNMRKTIQNAFDWSAPIDGN